MENSNFEQFSAFSKAATESAKQLEGINTQVFEKLVQKNMELFNSTVEMTHKFFFMFGETKGVQALITEQMQLTNEYSNKVMSTIKQAAEIVVESKDSYQSWIESGVPSVAPKQTATGRKNPPNESFDCLSGSVATTLPVAFGRRHLQIIALKIPGFNSSVSRTKRGVARSINSSADTINNRFLNRRSDNRVRM